MSVNKAILVGRLGRDPETRFTSGGQAVANFTLATDETFKDRSGERQKRTEWHRIVLWGKLAEILLQQYFEEGDAGLYRGADSDSAVGRQARRAEAHDHGNCGPNVMRMLTSRAEGACGGCRRRSATGSGGPGGTRVFDPDAEGGGGLPDEVAGPGPEISDEDIPF